MKKFCFVLGALLLVILATWGICETVGSDYYNYAGYIIDVSENQNGETVLVTLSGNVESEFIVKWYTKKSAPVKQPFRVGDRILLSTTHFSNQNIKKLKIQVGYSSEGKLFYAEGLDTPFVLATARETGEMYLINVITHNDSVLDDAKKGDTVRLYHAFPLSGSAPTVIAEAGLVLEQAVGDAFTAKEIAFVESKGYSVEE